MSGLPELKADLAASKAWGELSKAFAAANLESPVIDARMLVCHALGINRTRLVSEPTIPLGDRAPALVQFARRRLAREPVSRIIGERAFHGRQFKLSAATLDPRADSETLVEAALYLFRQRVHQFRPRILDLGTGSGCLLLSLLAELPGASGVGVDASHEALETARANALALGIGSAADFRLGDWATGLDDAFDIVVANPPYIRTADLTDLAPEVTKFDPMLALDGGTDGLDAYRAILASPPKLAAEGSLLFEVGAGQASDVSALVARRFAAAAPVMTLFRDLAGIERVVAASFPKG